jgi:hypothetical protein
VRRQHAPWPTPRTTASRTTTSHPTTTTPPPRPTHHAHPRLPPTHTRQPNPIPVDQFTL